MESKQKKIIVAFVGMPGAGKTEVSFFLQKKGIPFVRFGDITEEGLKKNNMPLTPQAEKEFREKIRSELGMAAYAIRSKPKIEALLKSHDVVGIDGLYSWEEYLFLKKDFPNLILVHIFTEPQKRYKRLSQRKVRPLTFEESHLRDIAEIEKLNKAGPIAIADYLLDNNDSTKSLHTKINNLLIRLTIHVEK